MSSIEADSRSIFMVVRNEIEVSLLPATVLKAVCAPTVWCCLQHWGRVWILVAHVHLHGALQLCAAPVPLELIYMNLQHMAGTAT
jgi:hypothetical protein